MQDQSSFTGRSRQRKTRRSVLIADRIARSLISVGGIGTILAVLGVCVFLFWVVVPLFLPADIGDFESFDAAQNEEILHLGVDEYRVLSWILRPSGSIEVYRLDTGEQIDTLQLIEGTRIHEASFLLRGDLVALALDNGEVQLAEIGFETSIADVDEVPAEIVAALEGAELGTIEGAGNRVYERTRAGQYRAQELKAELGRSTRIANGPVRRISHSIGPNGPLILALAEHDPSLVVGAETETIEEGDSEPDVVTPEPAVDSDGEEPSAAETQLAAIPDEVEGTMLLVLIAGEESSNFLTGETILEFSDPEELPYEALADGVPSHVAIAGSGSAIYVAWRDGSMFRLDRTRPSEVFVAERGRLIESGELTVLSFVLGNNTLVWGSSDGRFFGGFPIEPQEGVESAGLFDVEREAGSRKIFGRTKLLADRPGAAAIRAVGSSSRTRLVLTGSDDGTIKLYNVTNATRLSTTRLPSGEAVLQVRMAPKEDGLVAATASGIYSADLDPRHPEASIAALFRPVWYEGYDLPKHTWQSSSGTDDFEVKLGLVPLVFGTLKATLYSMLFGVPLALLAAIFTSEFLHPKTKAVIKPSIELMASLPSVVLGFLAALVFAPFVERIVPATLASFFCIPFAFLLGAFLWQLLPIDVSIRYQHWRFGLMAAMVPVGFLLASWVGPLFERLFFAGDFKQWLAWNPGEDGAELYQDAAGGWMLMWMPLSLIAIAWGISRWVDPKLRELAADWDRQRLAMADFVKFVAGLLLVFGLAYLLSAIFVALGFDPRGGYVDTYIQRNALIVGFVMGFAIIPIIYTISEDALSTVPEHLRSASLGAGATPWQTATRIVVPTAMSGLFSAMMVGLGRAVGETMIVLMAAGNTPVLEWNIFNGFRTLSANIAVELPEAVRNSTHYRTLFLAALVLFIMTFLVNTVAEVVRQRFRKRAYQL